MAENIKISIALAACSGSRYIADQLQSLLSQTRVPDEVIITDDSPDASTFEAIKPFMARLPIRYEKNPLQLGVSKNFEKALNLARGEVIFLCDQDDIWNQHKVETLYNALQENPDIDGVFCNSDLVNEDLEKLHRTLWDQRNFTCGMQQSVNTNNALKVFLKRVTCSSHNIAVRRRALDYLLPFPELSPFYPDTFIALSIAARSSWRAIPETLTLYRIHSSNESSPQGAAVASARRARSNHAALRNALLAREIIKRSNGNLSSAKQKSLQKFAEFHQARDSYSSNIFLRFFQVIFQACKLNYLYYANNLRTILADVFIK